MNLFGKIKFSKNSKQTTELPEQPIEPSIPNQPNPGSPGGNQPNSTDITSQKKSEEEESPEETLNKLVENSENILFKTSSVWWLDLFPDEITIDINKVDVITRYFLESEKRHSVRINDITDVSVTTSPWFASLTIVDKNYTDNEVVIRNLPNDQAVRARRIIQGLMSANDHKIDLAKIDKDKLVEKIEELGKMQAAER